MLVWVTSFNQPIYQSSGRRMVETFVSTDTAGLLAVHAENVPRPRPPGTGEYSDNVIWRTGLADHVLLRTWLAANADIIPPDLGGKWAGPCRCKNAADPHAKTHKLPCPGFWFCRHASRWFRKIVALNDTLVALQTSGHQVSDLDDLTLIWVDADVEFITRVTEADVDSWFKGGDVFYLKGPKRKEWETGVVGLRGLKGFRFLNELTARYTSGRFRSDPRWDDCYQMRMTTKILTDLKYVDLATGASGHSDVVPHSPLGKFLTHRKGHHSRVIKLFT